MTLHRVARVANVPEDRGLEVQVLDSKILLLRAGEQLRAYQAECPHAGAPLADGAICHGRLTCPWHKAQFRIEDGGLWNRQPWTASSAIPSKSVTAISGSATSRCRVATRHRPTIHEPSSLSALARQARQRQRVCAKGFGGRLLLIDREADSGYDRTALSKYVIAGEMPLDEVPPLRDEDFYRKQRIERLRGEVASLDAPNRTLRLTDGQSLAYDAALLATGGVPNPLTLPGADLPQVFVLRSKAHAQQILDSASAGQRVVIIGDSFIAMESASSLRQLGLNVTVLARHEVPFAKQFGDTVGKAIRARHEAHGVVFHTQGNAVQIEGTDKVEAVRLDNGEHLAADLVLVGIGVTPATAAFTGLPTEQDQSLRVDGAMRVADGLWAAGDIATFPLNNQYLRIEHWRLAQQQARIAAANMLGADEHYLDVPFFWTWHFGKTYDYLGHAQAGTKSSSRATLSIRHS